MVNRIFRNAVTYGLLFCFLLTCCYTCVPNAEAETGITSSALQAMCDKLNYKSQTYWGYEGTQGVNPGAKESYDFKSVECKVGTYSSGWKSGTSGYYGYTYYTGANNTGGAYAECAGFALYLGYKLTNCDPLSSSQWTKYKSFDEAGTLQVGDIVAIKYKRYDGKDSTHMAMVYSANNGKYTFVQAGGGSNNQISRGYIFSVRAKDSTGKQLADYSYTTMDQLKYIHVGHYDHLEAIVLRYHGSIVQPVNDATTLEFREISYPKNYKPSDKGWDISSGKLVCDRELKTITTTILPANGGEPVSGPYSYKISGYSYNILSLETRTQADNGVHFSYIKSASQDGDYIWRLEAYDVDGRYLKLDMPFTANSKLTETVDGTIQSWSLNDMVIHPSGINLNKAQLELAIGKTETLVATVSPSNAANKEVNWSSSDTSVATVSSTGLVTAKKDGTATITASAKDGNGIKATCVVTVKVPVDGVKVTPNSSTLEEGCSVTLVPTISPSNASNKSVTWSSSNTAVAKVDSEGLVSAVGAGKAVITVKTVDGGFTDECKVTVQPRSGKCGDNATWKYNNGVLTISGTGAMYDFARDGTLPWNQYISSITTLKVEKGITRIGNNAFSSHKLTSVQLDGTVKSIGNRAFLSNTSLTTLALPEGLETIERDAFAACYKLKTITLPSTLKTIGGMAFQDAVIESITIPGSVTSIVDNPFCGCTQLKSIMLNGGNSFKLVNGVLYTKDGNRLVAYPLASASTSYQVEPGTKEIDANAFYGATNLIEVTMPEGLTQVGNTAFYRNQTIQRVYLPMSLSRIDALAFSECKNLTLYGADGSVGQTFAKNGNIPFVVYIGKCGDNATWKYNNGVLTISGTGAINDYTWYTRPWHDYRSKVTSLVINSGITKISNEAFDQFSELANVSLPTTLTSIGEYAFGFCYKLQSVVFPSGLQEIGYGAFFDCEQLGSVTIPASVKKIGHAAFELCLNQQSINVNSANSTYCSMDGVLYSKDGKQLILYPAGRKGAFHIPSGVTSIGNGAFMLHQNLTEVSFPDTVEIIFDYAFQGCKNLSNVELPDHLAEIAFQAFAFCDNLKSISIPKSVSYIGDHILWRWIDDEYVEDATLIKCYKNSKAYEYAISHNIPYELVTIGGICGNNATWEYEDGVLTIAGTGAMYDYELTGESNTQPTAPWYAYHEEVKSIIVSQGISSIGSFAFVDFYYVENVQLPTSLRKISGFAFTTCYNLSKIDLPVGLETIEGVPFSNCTSLTTITIPASVTFIGVAPLSSQLQSIYVDENNQVYCDLDGVLFSKDRKTLVRFPALREGTYIVPSTVETIGTSAFLDSRLSDIILPDYLQTIDEFAFGFCKNLHRLQIPESTANMVSDFIFRFTSDIVLECYENSVAHQYALNHDLAYSLLDNPLTRPDFTTPAALTTIEAEAFTGIAAKRVKLSDQVTAIGARAFANCPNLVGIYIPGDCNSIAATAFSGVTGLTIYSADGSYAEFFASKYGYDFVPVE